MTSGPAMLGRLRDALLDEVLGGLRADPEVDGVALIGSLGRGEADNWSDADLHVHPVGRTLWPVDGRVVFQRRAIEAGTFSFDQLNGSGPRQAATGKTADEVRKIHLSYVPVAGKYVARRSPDGEQMIRFLGGPAGLGAEDPATQVRALRGVAKDLGDPAWGWLGDAVAAHLELVEASW